MCVAIIIVISVFAIIIFIISVFAIIIFRQCFRWRSGNEPGKSGERKLACGSLPAIAIIIPNLSRSQLFRVSFCFSLRF